MAIKAIINNTEKEIEQIKNSDEQDIDYVYSRIGDTEVEGEPPISIKSIGGELADYRIYGNTVDGESVGDRTGNLFDEEYENIPENLPIYEAIYVGDGYFTLSTTAPLNANSAANLFLMSGDVQTGASTATTGVWSGHDGTVESVNGYITVAYRYQYGVDPRDYSTMLNAGSTALPYEPYGYKVPVTINDVTTNLYLPEPIKMVGDEAEYIDYAEQKMHRIGADDVDVTLPALSTIKGTNTLSVNTSIQPSNIYIKDSFDYKKVFTATRTIEDELPLNYRNIEDNDSTLSNYRIYGNTVGGDSVGDPVESGEHAGEYEVPVTVEGKNLWSGVVEQGSVSTVGVYADSTKRVRSRNISIEPGTYTISANLLIRVIYAYNDDNKIGVCIDAPLGTYSQSFTVPAGANNISIGMMKIVNNVEVNITPSDFEWGQIEKGSEATTYEPYHAPVTTPIYLPEQIRKVGDEAEYIDYAEQKMHRVRKNLLQNTATSQTKNGVTFTVNADKSITCNGTTTNTIYFAVKDNVVLESGTYVLTGCPLDGGQNTFKLYAQTAGGAIFYVDEGAGAIINYKSKITILITILSGYTCNNLTFYPMIRKAGIVDDTYEPYIENTDLDVTLPALPTIKGTNVLSVGTAVQPSEVYVKGKIKEIN